jgi:hypothetical protein
MALLLVLAAACGKQGPGQDDVAAARERAENAAGKLMETLFLELTTALKNGPPQEALHVCADRAPEVARKIQEEHGVSVRRFALRTRNKKNTPDAYERKWFEDALQSYDGGKGPAPKPTAEVVDGELRYIRPILLAEMCTKCHGTSEQISPEVRAALEERYPDDDAIGFKPGDLRGAVSVRVPLSK